MKIKHKLTLAILTTLCAAGAAPARTSLGISVNLGGLAWGVSSGHRGTRVGVALSAPLVYSPPAPVVYAPPMVYSPPVVYTPPPPPVVYAPPVVYTPPVVYAPPAAVFRPPVIVAPVRHSGPCGHYRGPAAHHRSPPRRGFGRR